MKKVTLCFVYISKDSIVFCVFQRNGTLDEVSTIHTGHAGMESFGLLDKLNGLDHLPFWENAPCNFINASEGM